jgi:hypothetical protein
MALLFWGKALSNGLFFCIMEDENKPLRRKKSTKPVMEAKGENTALPAGLYGGFPTIQSERRRDRI